MGRTGKRTGCNCGAKEPVLYCLKIGGLSKEDGGMKKSKMVLWAAVLLAFLAACGGGSRPHEAAPERKTIVSEPSSTDVPLEIPEKQAEATPVQREPRALEVIPAQRLKGISPAAREAGLDLYLLGEDGDFRQALSYGQRERGQVIAARPGEDGHVLGSYHTDRESWGTLSPLDGKSVCFNNYEELVFVDTKEWVDTGFVLDFQQPQEPNCRISSLAFDPKQEEYLAIYQVSSYTMSSDGEVRPWMTFENNEDVGAQDAHMEFQRFDRDGRFLERVVTDLEPYLLNEVSSCLPNDYRDGMLTFLQKSYIARLVRYDISTGEARCLPCDGAVLAGDVSVTYRFQYNEPGGVFFYDWYENGEKTASLELEEDLDLLTLGIGNAAYPMELAELDPEARRLVMCSKDYIFHCLDFQSGTAAVEYRYSKDVMGAALTVSPDGRFSVHRIGYEAGGEAYFEELAAWDGQAGRAVCLGVLNNASDEAVTWDNQYVARYLGRVESCRLETGEWRVVLSAGEDGGRLAGERLLELRYDAENRLLLLLHTPYFDPFAENFSGETDPKTLVLDVYSENWELLRSFDTGVRVPYSLKAYGPYSPDFRLENGSAVLWDEDRRQNVVLLYYENGEDGV